MTLSKHYINGVLLKISFFLAFVGYYVFLMIFSNVGLIELSRFLTIPIRVVIILSLLGVVVLNRNYFSKDLLWYTVFSIIYIGRIFYEMEIGTINHMDNLEYLTYFLTFSVVPFSLLSIIKLSEKSYQSILSSMLSSCLVFSVCCLAFYQTIFGQTVRISSSIGRDENYISPLALSYCSVLGIGIGISYIISNKAPIAKQIQIALICILSVVPFFLGASRGSIFALVVPFAILLVSKKRNSKDILFITLLSSLMFGLILVGEKYDSNLLERTLNIDSEIANQSSSAIRTTYWKEGLAEFSNSPIFGASLELRKYGNYPHNIVIEVLLSTGLVGFLPFLVLLISGFNATLSIFRLNEKYAWVGIIFLQSLIMNMFSGAIYSASWFWLSLALVLITKKSLAPKILVEMPTTISKSDKI